MLLCIAAADFTDYFCTRNIERSLRLRENRLICRYRINHVILTIKFIKVYRLKAAARLIMAVMATAWLFWAQDINAEELRLMSYNIRNARGLDGKTDTKRIAAVIERFSPEVVALQEIDSITGRSRGRDFLAEVADHTGMRHVYAPAIDFDGGKYGVGILCRKKPLKEIRVALPGREEQRTLLAVEFEEYVFACTHLSLTEEDRLASLAIIDSVAALFDKPVFIAGDFNSHPEDAFMREFTKEFEILSTVKEVSFPADKPEELLDYITVGRNAADAVMVKRSRVVDEPVASDHRPVYADIVLKQHRDKDSL